MLPFEPELEESLKARYPDAVREPVDIEKMGQNPEDRPGLKRKHVFDFFDGLRLIISKDLSGLVTALHVSASMFPSNNFSQIHEYMDFVMEHYVAIRGEPIEGSISFMVTTEGIIHIIIPEKHSNPKWN